MATPCQTVDVDHEGPCRITRPASRAHDHLGGVADQAVVASRLIEDRPAPRGGQLAERHAQATVTQRHDPEGPARE